jgi:lipopolysaccharide export system protein LptC
MGPRRLLLLALLSLLVVALAWWIYDPATDGFPRRTATPQTPDYAIDRFKATSMGMNGRAEQVLEAERLLHYPDDDSTELTAPKLTVYDGELPPWRIDAEKGRVSGDGDTVFLEGGVEVNREAAAETRPVQIRTTNLRVRRSDRFAETGDPIEIQSGGSWVNAVGMKVWFGEPVRVKLLSEVRGQYEVD